MAATIEIGQARLGDFKIHTFHHTGWQKLVVTGVSVRQRMTVPTVEFWDSLLNCFGIPKSAMRFHDPAEVFCMLVEVAADRVFRYQIRQARDGTEELVGLSDPCSITKAIEPVRTGWRECDFATVN